MEGSISNVNLFDYNGFMGSQNKAVDELGGKIIALKRQPKGFVQGVPVKRIGISRELQHRSVLRGAQRQFLIGHRLLMDQPTRL